MNRVELDIARSSPDFEAGDRFLERELTDRGRPVKISEGRFTDVLIAAARMYFGWRVLHIRPARKAGGGWVTPVSGDGEGFPDLLLLRKSTGHEVAAELKVNGNKPTADQLAWLSDFEACGTPSFVWWPADLVEIQAVLRHGAEVRVKRTDREGRDVTDLPGLWDESDSIVRL